MTVTLDHPLVMEHPARFDQASASLPPVRRAEMREERQAHVADAMQAHGDGDISVRVVLDRLGDPAQIVVAESEAMRAGFLPGAPTLPSRVAPLPVAQPGVCPWGGLEIGVGTALLIYVEPAFVPVASVLILALLVVAVLAPWCAAISLTARFNARRGDA